MEMRHVHQRITRGRPRDAVEPSGPRVQTQREVRGAVLRESHQRPNRVVSLLRRRALADSDERLAKWQLWDPDRRGV